MCVPRCSSNRRSNRWWASRRRRRGCCVPGRQAGGRAEGGVDKKTGVRSAVRHAVRLQRTLRQARSATRHAVHSLLLPCDAMAMQWRAPPRTVAPGRPGTRAARARSRARVRAVPRPRTVAHRCTGRAAAGLRRKHQWSGSSQIRLSALGARTQRESTPFKRLWGSASHRPIGPNRGCWPAMSPVPRCRVFDTAAGRRPPRAQRACGPCG